MSRPGKDGIKLRSEEWFNHPSFETRFQHASAMRACGHNPESYQGRPIIGIFNSWNDLLSCNAPHKELVEHVKRGVLLAGGYPLELHTITTPSDFMKPSDLPYRNLMSMDVEELIRALPIDGAVMLCECDKTTPAQLMAAASCDLPVLQLAAGHRSSGTFRGKKVNYGTDLWKYMDDFKAGLLSESDMKELETSISCTAGGCPVMGTASTMKSLSEIIGMMLPGTAAIPATDARRRLAAEKTGKRIVEMVYEGLTPSRLMTEAAFHNAIKLLAALGGSTNAVLHLTAIAGRLGIRIHLEQYASMTKDIPLIVNLQPSGEYSMDDFYHAGGLSGVIYELMPRLDSGCLTALGLPLAEVYTQRPDNPRVIVPLDQPFKVESGIRVLRGNLAPSGAILKPSASSRELWKHRGKAYVFDSYESMLGQIDRDDLDVDASTILVLSNCGPSAIGMPEWGEIPIPAKLLKEGVTDMVRISDARMSGTSYGTVILHVAPEAAAGGPLAIVRSGDLIAVDVEQGILHLELSDETIEVRLRELQPAPARYPRGYLKLFGEHVLQADEGCDLDFLKPANKEEARFVPPIIGRG
ncbi:dihydroxy-acid dehydratase (plasmid) [Paenibacillus rhizovicinus]|uniref:Dihydroxy-acid dehydratase n=1 Tax=Paenibacillus rhizovicinus TaxID=2704463 RepID=A0A6C0PAD3_9BACL|nr:dihydroxy-acid dehydratase [Paenibacillus rhizovicinus]QHW35534.1 dihydroxy-acid dehydratase [Paenibacillus rhizovicinus]